MAEDYLIQVDFDSEKSEAKEREAMVEKSVSETNGNVNIENWEKRVETELSVDGTMVELAVVTLAVNGTDTLLSLYQLLKTTASVSIHRITGETKDGDEILTYSADEVTQELVDANDVVVLGNVEGDVIIKGGHLYPKEIAEHREGQEDE
ncbi:MAG TPA: hypothetical protein VFJ06_10650 [Halococcus sp.]|nr:hypothetical protein [Halococcus sp.]